MSVQKVIRSWGPFETSLPAVNCSARRQDGGPESFQPLLWVAFVGEPSTALSITQQQSCLRQLPYIDVEHDHV